MIVVASVRTVVVVAAVAVDLEEAEGAETWKSSRIPFLSLAWEKTAVKMQWFSTLDPLE